MASLVVQVLLSLSLVTPSPADPTSPSLSTPLSLPFNPYLVPDNGTYSCSELQRWVRTEKHYSNERKNSIFQLMTDTSCSKSQAIQLSEVVYSQYTKHEKFFSQREAKCSIKDALAVIFLSNFSINHNFSHFIHALLRLFCSLVDSRLVQWDQTSQRFHVSDEFVVWLDENFKLSGHLLEWLKPFGKYRELSHIPRGGCASTRTLVYGSGCVKLLPPEKWFGYPGCRAKNILPSFSYFMKSHYAVLQQLPVVRLESLVSQNSSARLADSVPSTHINLAFGIRKVGSLTGTRSISNLASVQSHLDRSLRLNHQIHNISFEDMSPGEVLDSMARVHIFISVHGAGMTNTFFMSPGTAVVEILPFPLCSCRSPDYFYGIAGYYQGSSLALGLKHYVYCVDSYRTKFQSKPGSPSGHHGSAESGSNSINIAQTKCNWKHLHSVQEVELDEGHFAALLRSVERDLVAAGMVELTGPVINMNPHANG